MAHDSYRLFNLMFTVRKEHPNTLNYKNDQA